MRLNQNNHIRPLSFLIGFLFLFSALSMGLVRYSQASSEPLVITEVKSTLTTNGQISISWKTNKLSDSLVEYSTDESFSAKQKNDVLYIDRSITLPRLTPDTLYHYHVISTTPQGERVVGPHLLFQSQTSAEINISKLQLRSGFHWYDQEQPLLGAQGLDLQISNQGQEPVTNEFSLSLILSQTAEGVSENNSYSCFAQVDHQHTLPAETTETLLLDSNLFAHCDPLISGNYTLTVAVDYDDQVAESDETNNVSSIDLVVEDHDQTVQFSNISIDDLQATSTKIYFSLKNDNSNIPVVVDVAPDYYTVDHPGMYLWSQDTTVASST